MTQNEPVAAAEPTGVDETLEAEQPGTSLPYKDDTSDGTTAPKASDATSAEDDLEPADDTPAEQGDDTAVDHDGNDLEGLEQVRAQQDEADAEIAAGGEQA